MATFSNDPNSSARFVDAGSAQRMRDTAHEAVDRVSSAANDTVDRLSAGARDTVDRMADNASAFASKGGQLVTDLRDWMTAYPWRAVGLAAAAGFLIVRMMR